MGFMTKDDKRDTSTFWSGIRTSSVIGRRIPQHPRPWGAGLQTDRKYSDPKSQFPLG